MLVCCRQGPMGSEFHEIEHGGASVQCGSASVQRGVSSVQRGVASVQRWGAFVQRGGAFVQHGGASDWTILGHDKLTWIVEICQVSTIQVT